MLFSLQQILPYYGQKERVHCCTVAIHSALKSIKLQKGWSKEKSTKSWILGFEFWGTNYNCVIFVSDKILMSQIMALYLPLFKNIVLYVLVLSHCVEITYLQQKRHLFFFQKIKDESWIFLHHRAEKKIHTMYEN